MKYKNKFNIMEDKIKTKIINNSKLLKVKSNYNPCLKYNDNISHEPLFITNISY